MNYLLNFTKRGCCLLVIVVIIILILAPLLCVLQQCSAPPPPSRYTTAPTRTARPTRAATPAPTRTPTPHPRQPLRIESVSPADGSEEVETRDAIEVTFNQPMVDLAEGQGDLPTPIVFEPTVEGNGRWARSNVYRFLPDGLQVATRYVVTIPADTTSLAGTELHRDYVFAFSTIRPAPSAVVPRPGAESEPPDSEIRITFNMPMDHESVESRFALTDADDRPIAGTFHWRNQAMYFTPKVPLARSGTYHATLAAGAYADGKDETLDIEDKLAWQFTVAGLPTIVSSAPVDGDMAARPGGVIVIQFNVPMDTASVEGALSISPEPEEVELAWQRNDTRLEAYLDIDPSAEYRVLLGKGVVDRYGEPLTGNRSIVFLSAPLEPMLSLYGPSDYYQGTIGSYVADQLVQQYIEVRNLDAVTFTLSTVEPADFVATYRNRYDVPNTSAITRTVVHSWTQSLDLPLNRIKYVSVSVADPDGELPAGVYLLEVRAGSRWDARFMVVSRANLALKWGPGQVFVWATDLVGGEVIPDMEIAVYGQDGALLVEGATNQDGVFQAEADVFAGEYWQRWEQTLFVVGQGPGEGDLALCASHWDQGITVGDFGLPQDYGEGATSTGYLYSDRPIYRPGQMVYFKGIVRADDDGRYTLLSSEHVTVPISIMDSQGNELYANELDLNEFGTVNGELRLSESAPLGRYTVQASLPGRGEPVQMSFAVAEYRKPEFQVQVSAQATSQVSGGTASYAVDGDVVTATVQADYYFGQPVPDAEVRWKVYGSPYYFSLPGVWYNFGEYDYDYWWYYGEEIYDDGRMVYASGTGRTDEQGQFAFRIPVDLSQSSVSQVFFVEASLTDANEQEVTGSAALVAHKTDTYLGVRPHRYVGAPGVGQGIDVIALDPLKEPRAGVTITVELYALRWDSVREKTESGTYRWRNVQTEILTETHVVTTSAAGTTQVTVTPPYGGEYKVVARIVDGLGNESTSNTYLWVWGDGYINWGMSNNDRVQLVADKREYEPGETAEILVTAPFTGCLALITIERGGVLSYEVQRVDGTSALLRVPIVADYAPNAFVSVSLLKGQGEGMPVPAFKLGYVELRVTRKEQQLNVTATADKARYKPGDTATYTIRATDYLGRGVSAELSVGVIDAAVLALLGDNAAPILDAFYYRRGLAVWNAQTLVISVDRLNETLEKRGKGGGGGGEGAEEMDIRRTFLDTAYWNPTVVTDWSGRAVIRVTLPDDLTTWRLRTKAVTRDTRVGDTSADVISTKDLLVRPVLPRFFAVGDEATISALVHNYTGVTQTVQVAMQTTGVQVQGGQKPDVTIVIPSGAAEKVSWPVSVPKVREAKVLFSARALESAASDVVEITLPVYATSVLTPLAANERVEQDEPLAVAVELPYSVDEMDELIIETAPSLGAGIRTGLEYLTGYPYG